MNDNIASNAVKAQNKTKCERNHYYLYGSQMNGMKMDLATFGNFTQVSVSAVGAHLNT